MEEDVLKPELDILVKLGSLAVHVEEMFSPNSHLFDKRAIETILQDEKLQNWLQSMNKLALLPVKRNK